MKPVKGLERPAVQWLLVGASAVLMVLLALTALTIWRTRGDLAQAAASQQALRADYEALDARLARERSAREAFELEAARLRERLAPGEPAADAPTLTLEPPGKPSATPPEPTVTAPDRAQVVRLRLVLPPALASSQGPFEIVARDWNTGRTLWTIATASAITVDGRPALSAHITGEMLPPGTYEIQVSPAGDTAPEAVASYTLGIGDSGGGRR